MRHLHPPPGWPQRRRTALPFPPGRKDDPFEVFIDAAATGERRTWHINLRTGEAFRRTSRGWDAPAWVEIPLGVQGRVRYALAGG